MTESINSGKQTASAQPGRRVENTTLVTEKRMFSEEIEVNLAYNKALFQAGILNRSETDKIRNTLETLNKRASYDSSFFESFPARNLHAFVADRLFQLIGDTALKLKTGRGTVEHKATVFRLWLRKQLERLSREIADLQKTLIDKCEEEQESILPGYADRQNEHPVLFVHWALAYFEMLARDRDRFDEIWRRTNVLPLGAGQLGGTSFEIHYEDIAEDLGFEGNAANSLDAVSDPDYPIEFVNGCSLCLIHLSRLAGDLMRYSDDRLKLFVFQASGSSQTGLSEREVLDSLQLLRNGPGRVFACQTALQTGLKDLPLSSERDLDLYRDAVFAAVDVLTGCLRTAREIFAAIMIDREKALTAATAGNFLGAEIVDYLIHRGVSYGTAQDKLKKLVGYAGSVGKRLEELSLEEFRHVSADFENDIFDAFSVENAVASKNQLAGTAPERVAESLQSAKEMLERE